MHNRRQQRRGVVITPSLLLSCIIFSLELCTYIFRPVVASKNTLVLLSRTFKENVYTRHWQTETSVGKETGLSVKILIDVVIAHRRKKKLRH